jgi:hypothetical protein
MTLKEIIRKRVQGIAAQLSSELAEELSDAILSRIVVRPDAKPKQAAPLLLRKRRNNPRHCVAPGCTAKHAGPRWSFRCLKHRKAR